MLKEYVSFVLTARNGSMSDALLDTLLYMLNGKESGYPSSVGYKPDYTHLFEQHEWANFIDDNSPMLLSVPPVGFKPVSLTAVQIANLYTVHNTPNVFRTMSLMGIDFWTCVERMRPKEERPETLIEYLNNLEHRARMTDTVPERQFGIVNRRKLKALILSQSPDIHHVDIKPRTGGYLGYEIHIQVVGGITRDIKRIVVDTDINRVHAYLTAHPFPQ